MAHLSYSRRKVARQIITDVLDDAVIAGRISSHRIKGIELVNGGRKKDLSDFVFPAHNQLTQLADGLGSRGLTIWLMRGCGLRIQEALAVQKSCFRDGGRTLRVYEQVNRYSTGTMALKHRKLGQYRDIPVPGYLWEMARDLPAGYLFCRDGVFSKYNAYLDTFKRHARKAGFPMDSRPTVCATLSCRLFWAVACQLQMWPSGSATRTSTSLMPFPGIWCRTLPTGPRASLMPSMRNGARRNKSI